MSEQPDYQNTLPEIMNADQAARFLGLSAWTVREYSKQGRIPHRRVGRRYIFSRAALLRWLEGGTIPELRSKIKHQGEVVRQYEETVGKIGRLLELVR